MKHLFKLLNFSLLFLSLVFTSNIKAQVFEIPRTGFVDENFKKIEKFESIYNSLFLKFGEYVPRMIKVIKYKSDSSFFQPYGNIPSVYISEKLFTNIESKLIKYTVFHETMHIVNFMISKRSDNKHGVSVYNQFRFLDEGFAEVLSNEFVENSNFGIEELKQASLQGKVDLAQVQNWWNKPPYEGAPGSFNIDMPSYYFNYFSYPAGVSFVLYLRTLGNDARIVDFFKSIGSSEDLTSSLKEVYDLTYDEAEKNWLDFIKTM